MGLKIKTGKAKIHTTYFYIDAIIIFFTCPNKLNVQKIQNLLKIRAKTPRKFEFIISLY